ncbi:hypothetical protein [Stappia stellulata]|uniref:hypothetical protein n=1 Tax=Stappia stellulata TaxID=71235 RepID=UPI000427453C|nr:hypothetical protein [Stappia stellulata]
MTGARHPDGRDGTDEKAGGPASLPRRLAWFAGLWLAGVAVLFAIASAIRWAIL